MNHAFDPATATTRETLDYLAADALAILRRMNALVQAACPDNVAVIVTLESHTARGQQSIGVPVGSVAVFMGPPTDEHPVGLMHYSGAAMGSNGFSAALSSVIASIAELNGDK